MIPSGVRYVVIGAGVHGLSTAWHLARELRVTGRGDGTDVLVIDKRAVAAGASGIACGVVRNNYFQPAMRELMAHSVAVWESDPDAFAYYPVGYLAAAPAVMADDLAAVHDQQRAIDYPSVLVDGRDACEGYLRDVFDDWQASNIEVVLHERRGGYANNRRSMQGLAEKAEAEGVTIVTGPEVRGFLRDSTGTISAVETDHGSVSCEQVIVGVGPWIRDVWAMLDLPGSIDVTDPHGAVRRGVPMWNYLALQEGTLGVDPRSFVTTTGQAPPVMHVDSDAPLFDEQDGSLITDQLWGIYYKPDLDLGGVQGGASPLPVDQPADQVRIDPYGPASPEFVVDESFVRLWTSALAHCHKRFEGARPRYDPAPSGGIGAFTPDNFPVFDTFCDNVHVIADSNHGFKMIGVGALVAKEILGEPQALLEPFRFERYATGALHPTSHSPFPWS
jgi:methylglutamate dehydrogenase subunit A